MYNFISHHFERFPTKNLIFLLLILLSVCGCSALNNVRVEKVVEADFSHYLTFTLSEVDQKSDPFKKMSPILLDRLQKSVSKELIAKGYKFKQDVASAELIVKCHGDISERRLSINQNTLGISRWDQWSQFSNVNVSDQNRSTWMVDLIDSKTKKLIWRSSGKRLWSKNVEDDKLLKRITASLLADLPSKD